MNWFNASSVSELPQSVYIILSILELFLHSHIQPAT